VAGFAPGDRIVYHDPEIPFLDFPGVVLSVADDPTGPVTVRLDDPLPERPDVVEARPEDLHPFGTRCSRCAPA
jgi:hypothetical protein